MHRLCMWTLLTWHRNPDDVGIPVSLPGSSGIFRMDCHQRTVDTCRKEKKIIKKRTNRHLQPAPSEAEHIVTICALRKKNSMMQGAGNTGKSSHTHAYLKHKRANTWKGQHLEREEGDGYDNVLFCTDYDDSVRVSTTHRPSAAATHHWILSQLSCSPLGSGLDKSLPTNCIMGPASKRITHGADRHVIAPVCHTPLAFPAKSSGLETVGRAHLGAGCAPQTRLVCASVFFPKLMLS